MGFEKSIIINSLLKSKHIQSIFRPIQYKVSYHTILLHHEELLEKLFTEILRRGLSDLAKENKIIYKYRYTYMCIYF